MCYAVMLPFSHHAHGTADATESNWLRLLRRDFTLKQDTSWGRFSMMTFMSALMNGRRKHRLLNDKKVARGSSSLTRPLATSSLA